MTRSCSRYAFWCSSMTVPSGSSTRRVRPPGAGTDRTGCRASRWVRGPPTRGPCAACAPRPIPSTHAGRGGHPARSQGPVVAIEHVEHFAMSSAFANFANSSARLRCACGSSRTRRHSLEIVGELPPPASALPAFRLGVGDRACVSPCVSPLVLVRSALWRQLLSLSCLVVHDLVDPPCRERDRSGPNDVAHRADRARVIHSRRSDDADVSEVLRPSRSVRTQTAAAERLRRCRCRSRHAPRRRRASAAAIDEARAIFEEPQHVPRLRPSRELRLREDVLIPSV